jgi:pimeloyl-ACP methyl ester carboxylesterase
VNRQPNAKPPAHPLREVMNKPDAWPVGTEQRTESVSLRSGALTYTVAGSGEPLLLIHGLGGTRGTWTSIMNSLATKYTVIAPDLPGHGDSDTPAGDYSLGAHATVMRDLLISLGHPSATVIGHSLGGGIALQFAYQFPERTHRLVLISSGGLGPELTVMLRAATLPGASAVVAGLARVPEPITRTALKALSVVPGFLARQDAEPLAGGIHGLREPRRRRGFIGTAHTVIDWRGQAVSAVEHLGLLVGMPIMVAWGNQDRTIPPHHHRSAALQLPDAETVEIPAAGHYPHETAAAALLPRLHAFLAGNPAFRYNESRWRQAVIASVAVDTPAPECTDMATQDRGSAWLAR